MQYDRNDSFLSAAFAVIQQYDPDTYARMQSARWHVARMDPIQSMLMDAFGATHSVGESMTRTAESLINADQISEWARQHHAHTALFAADVIVHEFRHIHQPEFDDDSAALEVPAFAASVAFAKRLPKPDGAKIARESDDTLRYVKSQEAHNA